MRQELGFGGDALDNNMVQKYEGLLEKKWIGVVRLQKKVQHQHSLPSPLQEDPQMLTRKIGR